MLDKSLPYYNILMKRQNDVPFFEVSLPNGFSFTKYTSGDEIYWAEIEKSVGEFKDVHEGLKYFEHHYLPYIGEVSNRVIFLNTSNNEKIGTITAWWNYTGAFRNLSLHWVAVKPEFQGLGLGRPLINYGIKTLIELDGNDDIYVHTQTWSHTAIAIYLKEGFRFMNIETFGGYRNDFDMALPFLQEKINLINLL
jgi:ribosomal protein S18 acetylase RimI-like enzyme